MPLLAHAYALHFAGQHMNSAYHHYVDTQDAEALPDLHATSAGLKALVTQVNQHATCIWMYDFFFAMYRLHVLCFFTLSFLERTLV